MPKTAIFRQKLPERVWGGKKSDPSDSQAKGRGFDPRLPLQTERKGSRGSGYARP
jgi:hypothetical protein